MSTKVIAVANYVVSPGSDMLALTETWLGDDTDQLVISELVPSGYEFKHVPRANQNGGGGMIHRSELSVKVSESEKSGIYIYITNIWMYPMHM